MLILYLYSIFKGYDGIYILNYIYQNWNRNDKEPFIIKVGSKINYLTFRGLRFVDSLNFLPMSLEKFSDTFNIKELKKSFFPHRFNIKENFDYVGHYPDKKYYDSERFTSDKKEKFDIWYDSNKNNIFNFKNELYEYCKSDVLLLQEGCLQFRSIIYKISEIDPFVECITIASLCHMIYRKMNMKAKSIGLIPCKGFKNSRNQQFYG